MNRIINRKLSALVGVLVNQSGYLIKVIARPVKNIATSSNVFTLIGGLVIWSVLYHVITRQFDPVQHIYPWVMIIKGMNGQTDVIFKITGFITLFSGIALIIYSEHQKYLSTMFGDAHFASEVEIRDSGLRADNGIILGLKRDPLYRSKFLIVDNDEHILAFMTTGSGKGLGLVIPNLLNWNDSALIIDMKHENYQLTSGYRKKYGQEVYLFDPVSNTNRTHRFNPLDYIDHRPEHCVNDIQVITEILWPKENDKDIWQPEARSFFLAIALYLIRTNQALTFGEIRRFPQRSTDLVSFLTEIVETEYETLDRACIDNFMSMISAGIKTRDGILKTFREALELWDNPIIDAATSTSDFDVRDFRRKRMTVYLGVTPKNLGRLAPLINMFVQVVVSEMTDNEPDPAEEPYKLLLLLDEFTALGRLSSLEKAVGFLRSFNVKFMPVIQDLAQLSAVYGKDGSDTMLANCKIKSCASNTSATTTKYIADQLGTKTIKQTSQSISGGTMFDRSGSISKNKSYTRQALMLPDQIARMSKDKMIIMLESHAPIKAKKIRYFTDKRFASRILPAPEVPSIDICSFMEGLRSVEPIKIDQKSDNDKPPSREENQQALLEATT